jgi:WD40 repeat protein
VLSIALTSNEEKVVSRSVDNYIRIWSVLTLQLLFQIAGFELKLPIISRISQLSKFKFTDIQFGMRLSNGDKFIFSRMFRKAIVWNLTSGSTICFLANLEEAEDWILKYPRVRTLVESLLV